MTYLFDTSAFISWWHEIYPVKIFEDVAKLIENDIEIQLIQSPAEVRQELEEKIDDPLTEWVKTRPNLFIPTQPELQSSIADISNKYPKILKRQGKVNADPVVIALAHATVAIVVTQENRHKQNNIVGCCRDMSVGCISLSQYIGQRQELLNAIRTELWG